MHLPPLSKFLFLSVLLSDAHVFCLNILNRGSLLQMNLGNILSRDECLKRIYTLSAQTALATGFTKEAFALSSAKKMPVVRLSDDFDTPQLKGLNGDDNPGLPEFRTLPSGVRITDIQVGSGPEVSAGSVVTMQWVLRRSNGYFVDSSATHNFDPFIYRVGDKTKAIEGLDLGIRGMRQGGKRRLVIPPKVGYTEGVGENKPGPVPIGYGPQRQVSNRARTEPFFFEVEVTRIRNPGTN